MNCSKLPFPLNFYATVLKLEYGQVEMLTYGCYGSHGPSDATAMPLNEAQRQLARQVIDRVLDRHETKLSILLFAETQHYLADSLISAGHDVVYPCPLNREEGKDIPESEFDVVVLDSSYPYHHQLGLFSRARKALKKQGKLLLLAEFIADDSKISYSDLPNLSSCRQLLQRLGFELCAELDFTGDAQQTLPGIKALIHKHQHSLKKELAITESEFQQQLAELAQIATEYTSGRRCFKLFEWVFEGDTESEYANAEYGDIHSFQTEEIRQLFEKSFNVAFDPGIWAWKYQLGQGECVVAREQEGGEVVAHYGGAPRQILYFGRESIAIQVCDVMVLPEKRLHYGKKSLFFKVAATFLEREIGNTVRHLLGFGFPNQKAMNIALRLGLYEKTDDFVEVVLPAATGPASFALTDLDIDNYAHQQQVDCLWQDMAADLTGGIVGIRNWQYLKYRYFDHPCAASGQYHCYLLQEKSSSQALAILVFKHHEERLLLMDIICQQSDWLTALTAANESMAVLEAVNKQSKEIKIWITKAWHQELMPVGATVNELQIEIPCNSWNPGPDSATLYGAWWLTAGDMDFM